jgi:hypothetical protein
MITKEMYVLAKKVVESYEKQQLNIPVVSGSYSIEDELKDKIERGLINEKLEPIKCECGSTEFIDKTTDKIDYLEVEKDRFCKKCNRLVGYWSYGHWLP